MARNVLIIRNPTAGRRGRIFARTLEYLPSLGIDPEIRETRSAGDAEFLARRAAQARYDLVVACGGDGTVAEVVAGLLGGSTPLAILPAGTANVLAHTLRLPADPAALAELIARGEARPISLGRVTTAVGGEARARIFATMVGAGFDAEVVASVDLDLKRRVGKLAYGREILRQLRGYDFPPLHVSVDGEVHQAASVIVANAPYYGGRFLLAPEARLEEPILYVCIFGRGGPVATLAALAALARGRLGAQEGDVKLLPAERVSIVGPAGAPVQGDGDIIASLPVEIDILPAALSVVAPWR